MRIGHIMLANRLFAAPMAGVTDRPFRQLCKRLSTRFAALGRHHGGAVPSGHGMEMLEAVQAAPMASQLLIGGSRHVLRFEIVMRDVAL